VRAGIEASERDEAIARTTDEADAYYETGVLPASAGLIPAEVPPYGTPIEASSSASGPLASIKIWQVHCG
jgi:hypothetical protein